MSPENIEVRLARSAEEIDAAQRLRYLVFYQEWGALADARMRESQRDVDSHDQIMDHLIVIDHDRSPAQGQVVGEYRSFPILQRLWSAISAYVAEHDFSLLFGCASLRGTDPAPLAEQLAYLHHYHLAPEDLRPHAFGPTRLGMDLMEKSAIDPLRAMAMLEPIIKGYLRLGASIGEGAYVLTHKYRRHFERSLQRPLPWDPGPVLAAAQALRQETV